MSTPDTPPPSNPAPPPTPDPNDAAQAADRLEEDMRKKRNSTSGSYLGGNSAPAGAPTMGRAYLG